MSEVTATQLIWATFYDNPIIQDANTLCAVCGGLLLHTNAEYRLVKNYIKPTFTDHDILHDSPYICEGCAFAWDEASTDIMEAVGKDKPQRFRNYSWIVKDGQCYVLSKAQKREMADLIGYGGVPEIAIIAESGQKHLAFEAECNPQGQTVGWVQFEKVRFLFDQARFATIYDATCQLYDAGHTKDAILTGRYKFYPNTDIHLWHECETFLHTVRNDIHFELAVYLTTKSNENKEDTVHE